MESLQRSRDESKASTIPRGSFSLCNITYSESEKRNLKRKKRKRGSKISQAGSEEEYSSTTQLATMGEATKLSEMIMIMKEALKDKEVSESLTAAFREDAK